MLISGLMLYSNALCQEEMTQVSRVRMTGLYGTRNTLRILTHIPTKKSEYCPYEQRRELGVVMTLMLNMFECPTGALARMLTTC